MHPPKMPPQELMRAWVSEWSKEGVAIDWEQVLPPKGFTVAVTIIELVNGIHNDRRSLSHLGR